MQTSSPLTPSSPQLGHLRIQSSRWREFDIFLLALLLLSLTLYQLQHLFEWIVTFHVREALYAYLYIRILLFYRIRVTRVLIVLGLFFVCTLLVAWHTWVIHGLDIALPSFARFVNVALLAPLAAVLLVSHSQAVRFIRLWTLVVLAGAASILYQLLEGELLWLVRDYIAIRGDLIRYMSILGEPNVGGMAAPLLYLFGMQLTRSRLWRYSIVIGSVFLVVISLSKAAFVGFILANIILLALKLRRRPIGELRLKILPAAIVIALVVGATLFVSENETLMHYATTVVNAFAHGEADEPNVFEDLYYRSFGMLGHGYRLGASQSGTYLIDVLFGSSFGFAGSVAYEVRGEDALLPHNSYLEVFFVGGLLFLFVFVSLVMVTIRRFWNDLGTEEHKLSEFLFASLLLLSIMMFSYPNIYEPVTGAFFWFGIGIGANYYIFLESRAHKTAAFWPTARKTAPG